MASSSWYVAKILRNISFFVLIILFAIAVVWAYQHYGNKPGGEQNFLLRELIKLFAENQQKPVFAHAIISCIAPIMVLIGSCYIIRQVPKFIHY